MLVSVALNRAMSLNSCGTIVRVAAASISGLICTTAAPRFVASARYVSIRGALVAAFTPNRKIASACSQSWMSTVPLLVPIDARRATPLAS